MFDDILGPIIDKIDGKVKSSGTGKNSSSGTSVVRDKSWGAVTGTVWSSDAQVANPDWDIEPEQNGWVVDKDGNDWVGDENKQVKGEYEEDGFSDGLYDI